MLYATAAVPIVGTAPTGGDWIYELKFDGFRIEAIKNDAKVKLVSRNENDLTKKFDQVAAAVASLPCAECVIDGEVVAISHRRDGIAGCGPRRLIGRRRGDAAPLIDV